MGYLSQPYRVVYESKGLRTGLGQIQAFVFKPDKTIAGPYLLVEMPSVMAGRYYFDFFTSASDPEGEYMAAIISLQEGFQTTKRLSIYNRPADKADVTGILSALDDLGDTVDLITACIL